MDSLNTPILLMIFNRPDHVKKVIEAISYQKPKVLYVAADGPRESRPEESEKCALTRQLVLEAIDWECDVKLLFRKHNLGCGKAVHEAINWFFEHVEEGIILEDDCLPGSSFFAFCETVLIKYRHIEQVMHINGSRFADKRNYGHKSYYFSNYFIPYGWATWRRAWSAYTFDLPVETSVKFKDNLKHKFPGILERKQWERVFLSMANHEIDTWDTQWYYSIYNCGGVGITPVMNLVSNIGFDEQATHTFDFTPGVTNLSINEIDIRTMEHPREIKVSKPADQHTYKNYYAQKLNKFNKIKFIIGERFPFVKHAYLRLFKEKFSLEKNTGPRTPAARR